MAKDLNFQADLSTALQFLVNCCKIDPSKDDMKEILSYLNTKDVSTNTLISLAHQHGILPLVYKTLKNLQVDSSTLLTELKAHYRGISQHNMLMSAELIRIMKLLKDNDIKALAFKGPTLSQMVYGDITLRQYGDLDILIKPQDFIQVHTLLTDKMYDTKYNYTRAIDKVLELIPDHMFISAGSQIPIEIHNKLFASNFPIKVNDTIFWENSTTITINNKVIPTFKQEYLLFYLCLHGAKHLFSRISWILDIAMLIESTAENFDWELFENIVNENHLDTMVAVGLHLAIILFQTKMPDKVLQRINANSKSLKIAHSIINNISENPADSERFTFTHLSMFDSWSEKIKYSIYLFKPSVVDYQIFDNQYKSELLYYILRPWHILYRSILNVFQKKSS